MVLTNKEKIQVLISQAISSYSTKMQEGKTSEYQSVIDFILKNMPEKYKSDLTMEMIDDVFSFITDTSMELS